MAFLVDDDGNLTLVQGDNGTLVVEDLPTDKNYDVYFAFYNSKRKIVGGEVSVSANKNSVVLIVIPAALTDLLTVKNSEDTAEYYYGLKLCNADEGIEDTLIIEDGDIGDLNTVTVYPKKVEGIE